MMSQQTNPVLMKPILVKLEEPKRDGDVGFGLATKYLGSLQRFLGFETHTHAYTYIYIHTYISIYIYIHKCIYTVKLTITILWNINLTKIPRQV